LQPDRAHDPIVIQGARGLTVPNAGDVTVADNRIADNNRPNPATDPGDLLSRLPAGNGVLTIDADRVTITNNRVSGNDSVGIAVLSLPLDVAALDPRVDPIPDQDHVTAKTLLGNGTNPDPRLARSRRPTSCGTAREPETAGLATSSPRRSQARCRRAAEALRISG